MAAGEVVPLPERGAWLADARDDGRALRVSWHAAQGCAVLSTWRDGRCTGTARLRPDEVARLVAALADGLPDGAAAAPDDRPDGAPAVLSGAAPSGDGPPV
jgi:hypothetical protein